MDEFRELIDNLSSEDERERAFAVEDIVFDSVPGAIDLLIERLSIEPSRFVQEVIVNNLKTFKGLELVDKLLPLLNSDDAYIRNAVIDIVSCQDENAFSSIKALLSDPDKDVRKFAVDILFQLRSPYSAELIVTVLKDPDINIVITAVEYLGRLEATDYIAMINDIILNTDNLLLRCTCLEVMAVIGNQQSIETVRHLYAAHTSINQLELYSYLKFLATKGSEADLPLVFSLIKSKGKTMAKEIINTLQGILERASIEFLTPEIMSDLAAYIDSDINSINKYELLLFLADFQNEEILPILLKYAVSEEKLLCLGAVEGIGVLGKKEALPVLRQVKDTVSDSDILEAVDKSIENLDG